MARASEACLVSEGQAKGEEWEEVGGDRREIAGRSRTRFGEGDESLGVGREHRAHERARPQKGPQLARVRPVGLLLQVEGTRAHRVAQGEEVGHGVDSLRGREEVGLSGLGVGREGALEGAQQGPIPATWHQGTVRWGGHPRGTKGQ